MRATLIHRILSRLVQAEAKEPNAHLRDDYQIARLTIAFAARGSPQPHLDATYAVLGIHPDKVWPAIIKRRKSLLGALYGVWFDEHGQLRPSDCSEIADQVAFPPKKPVQGVRRDGSDIRKVAGGFRWWGPPPERSVSVKSERRGTLSSAPLSSRRPSMAASTQVAYLNSQTPPTGKKPSPFDLLGLVNGSSLEDVDRGLLTVMLLRGNRFAEFGTTNEITLGTLAASVAAGKPYVTARRRIDRLCSLCPYCNHVHRAVHSCACNFRGGRRKRGEVSKLCECDRTTLMSIKQIFPESQVDYDTAVDRDGAVVSPLIQTLRENTRVGPSDKDFRRPATYQVNRAGLIPRMTLEEHRERRFRSNGATPIRPQSVKHSPPPSSPTSLPAPAVSSRREKKSAVEKNGRGPTRRECLKLTALIQDYERGQTVGPFGKIPFDDERYRAPMLRNEAIAAACERFNFEVDVALKALKYHGLKLPDQKT